MKNHREVDHLTNNKHEVDFCVVTPALSKLPTMGQNVKVKTL